MTTSNNPKMTNVDRVKWAIARAKGGNQFNTLIVHMYDGLRVLDNATQETPLTDDQIKRAMRSIPNIKLGQKLRGRRTPK